MGLIKAMRDEWNAQVDATFTTGDDRWGQPGREAIRNASRNVRDRMREEKRNRR